MRLERAAREYISWAVMGLPDGATVQVQFPPDATWYDTERLDGTVRVLAAGPDAETNPPGTLVLEGGTHRPQLRVTDTPELVVRSTGYIQVPGPVAYTTPVPSSTVTTAQLTETLAAYVEIVDLAPVAMSGAYTDLTGRPALAAVATSGSASDLTAGTLAEARLPATALKGDTTGITAGQVPVWDTATGRFLPGEGGGAGLPSTIVNRTTAYTAAVGDFVLADTTAAGFTVTLPTGPDVGALVTVKKTDASANVVTVAPAAGGSIDADPNATITAQRYGGVFEHVGGNAWQVVAPTTSSPGPQGPEGPQGPQGPVGPAGAGAITYGYRTNWWYVPPASSSSTATMTNGQIHALPIGVTSAVTIVQLGVEVTTAGGTGSVLRLGIYSPGTDGLPGALLADAGTADSTTTGAKSVAASLTLQPGLHWLVAVGQGAPATNPVVRSNSGANPFFPIAMASWPANNNFSGYTADGATGALPATFPTTNFVQAQAARVGFRVA